jgi:hypothetical protein
MRVRGLFSQNTQEQYEATQWFRKLLSIGTYYIKGMAGVWGSWHLVCLLQAAGLNGSDQVQLSSTAVCAYECWPAVGGGTKQS